MQSIVWDLGRVLLSLVDPDAAHRPTGSTSLRSAQDDTREYGRAHYVRKSFPFRKVFGVTYVKYLCHRVPNIKI